MKHLNMEIKMKSAFKRKMEIKYYKHSYTRTQCNKNLFRAKSGIKKEMEK